MIAFSDSGSFEQTMRWLEKMKSDDIFNALDRFGQQGVDALAKNTPVDSGLTANSWTYQVKRERGRYSLTWTNTNYAGDTPVAILIQYGHGTGTGGWVQGRDFINPAILPLFDSFADEVWREVTNG